jgi:hypothetical protein
VQKRISVFLMFLLFQQVASAQSCLELFQSNRSEALEEFQSLVGTKTKARVVVEVSEQISEKYNLTLNEFLTILNWGPYVNFSLSTVVNKLETYSALQPLTPSQVDQILIKYPGNRAIIGRLSSSSYDKSQMARPPILEIPYQGSRTDFVKTFLTNYRRLDKEKSREFLAQTFDKEYRENLQTFRLGANDVTRILQELPYGELSMETLLDIRQTIGLEALAQIDAKLLLSRTHLGAISETLTELLLTYNVHFLENLIGDREFSNLPAELVETIHSIKKLSVASLGATGESLARDIFAKSASLMMSSQEGDAVALYEVSQVVAAKVISGELRSDVVEAFIDILYGFQNSRLIYEYDFTPEMAQYLMLQELPTLGIHDVNKFKIFFDKYMEAYKSGETISAYSYIYTYPEARITTAAIQAGLDLFKLDTLFGDLNVEDISLYFNLRFGRVYPAKPSLIESLLRQPMVSLDHEEALNFVRVHKGQHFDFEVVEPTVE